MGSYIQIDSISIDLANSIDKNDAGKCEHFSMRGYVSEIRNKDWRIGWPFPLKENHSDSDEQTPLLPPLDIPKFRWWCCQNCRQETASEGANHKGDRSKFSCSNTGVSSDSNCSNADLGQDIQQAPMPDTSVGGEIDLNNSASLSCENCCSPFATEKENKAEVSHSTVKGHDIGLEDNLNHQLSSVSAGVDPGPRQEAPTNHTGCEGDEVADVELATSSPKSMLKSIVQTSSEGTPISADDQCQKELIEACTVLEEVTRVTEVDHNNVESVAYQNSLPGNTDNLVANDFQDHHVDKSTGLPRRRLRKVRLLTDLLSENGRTKSDQVPTHLLSNGTSDASAAFQTLAVPPDRVNVHGDVTNMGQSRKRKFLMDEEWRHAEMCSQGAEDEVQNLEADVDIMNKTVLNTGSENVYSGIGLQDGAKSHGSKPKIEHSHSMGKKKNRKIQVVDNQLTYESLQGKLRRENQDNMDGTKKVHGSKTHSSVSAPHAFMEKGMDTLSLHAPRTENSSKLNKGKGKIQQDGELASLSGQKNGMLSKGSFAYTDTKIRSNTPVAMPVQSATTALNEKVHLSLNSYMLAHVYDKNCIHQIENQLPLPLPFQEGTSKVHQLVRRGRETNVVGEPSIPSKHRIDAISGKGVSCEVSSNIQPHRMPFPNEMHKCSSLVEDGTHFHDQKMKVTGASKAGNFTEAREVVGFMKRYVDQTADMVSEQGTVDDIPMEIVELMAKNQYERCLPDAENGNCLLDKSSIRRKAHVAVGTAVYGKGESRLSQEGPKEVPWESYGKNVVSMTSVNVGPSKRKSVEYFPPFDGSHLNMNDVYQSPYPFGVEVSHSQTKPSGFHFSPMDSGLLGSAQNSKFNGSTAEHGSSDAISQAHGGCSLHKTILHKDDEASRIWASLAPNQVPLAYDMAKRIPSHSTSTNMDMIACRSGAVHKENIKRNFDLNCPNLDASELENLNRNMGPETFSRMNAFPCKHNGTEPHQNLKGSIDLYSNETIPAMHLLSLMDAGMQSGTPFSAGVSAEMLKRPSYPHHCNTKLEIGASKASASLKHSSSDYYSRNHLADKSRGLFLPSPNFGASPSVIRDDQNLYRASELSSHISSKSGSKDKMKNSNAPLQTRGGKSCKATIARDGAQKRLPGMSDLKMFSWPLLDNETSIPRKSQVHGTRETLLPVKYGSQSNICCINRNPADFTVPERGNVYMIRGEDLKFVKPSISKSKPGLHTLRGTKQQKNLKRPKLKDHAKH